MRYLLFVLLLFVGGCATQSRGPTGPVDLPAQLATLAEINQWQAKGKMALKEEEEAFSASMRWKVDNANFEFKLTNLLGITLVDMKSDNAITTLEADGETYQDSDASRLIRRVTGWSIPVTQLINWTKGLPNPEDQYVLREDGLVASLTPGCTRCEQWEIRYDRYRQIDGIWLPHSVVLQHRFIPNKWIKIRISAWTLNHQK